jgi:CRP/FNR family transcriptional regulator, cyclic AMP receptor protein
MPGMNAPSNVHRLDTVPLFAEFSPEMLDSLARSSRVREYPKGQVICSEDDPGDSLIVLEQGQARVSRFTTTGQEVVLSVVDAPAAFGELALIDGAPRSATITATSPVTLRLIERSAFLEAVEREPALAVSLLHSLAGMVRGTNERLADLLTLEVPGRLAKWLLSRSETQPPVAGSVVPFAISQSDLAADLGATRVSVNRALKTFERRHVIALEPHQIRLLDPDALRERAQ